MTEKDKCQHNMRRCMSLKDFPNGLLSSIIISVSMILGILISLVSILSSWLCMLCSYGPVWYDEETKTAGHLQPYGSYRMHGTRTGTETGTGTKENKNALQDIGCALPTFYCRGLPWQRLPLNRESPWTEAPLDRDPLDRLPLDRDLPGQRPPTMDRQKPVKTLPLQTLYAVGNNGSLSLSQSLCSVYST